MKTPDIIYSEGPELKTEPVSNVIPEFQIGDEVRFGYARLRRAGLIKNIYAHDGVIEYLVMLDKDTWIFVNPVEIPMELSE